MTAITFMPHDYFVYCLACKRRVVDPTEPCTGCGSAKDMVDWCEPPHDCTALVQEQDCITRNVAQAEYCDSCKDWAAYETARTRKGV
jgi:hypothetical protein